MFFLLVILIVQVIGCIWFYSKTKDDNALITDIKTDIKKGEVKHHGIIDRISTSSHKKDDILMKNQKYLNNKISELTQEINDLSLKILEDSNEVSNIKDNIASIPKVRETGLHFLSMRDEIIMFTDHFTFNEEGSLVFHAARTNLTEGFIGDLGKIPFKDSKDNSNKKCRELMGCTAESCNNLKGNYWLNVQTDGINDFCESCTIEKTTEDDDDAPIQLKNSCSLYIASPSQNNYTRFYKAYYDFKNVLDSMDYASFLSSFSDEKIKKFETHGVHLTDNEPVLLTNDDVGFRKIGINDDIENVAILAYHMKKIGKSIPHLKL